MNGAMALRAKAWAFGQFNRAALGFLRGRSCIQVPIGCVPLQNIAAHMLKPEDLEGGALQPYLLGLLAMIKCSICSYQCDN